MHFKNLPILYRSWLLSVNMLELVSVCDVRKTLTKVRKVWAGLLEMSLHGLEIDVSWRLVIPISLIISLWKLEEGALHGVFNYWVDGTVLFMSYIPVWFITLQTKSAETNECGTVVIVKEHVTHLTWTFLGRKISPFYYGFTTYWWLDSSINWNPFLAVIVILLFCLV